MHRPTLTNPLIEEPGSSDLHADADRFYRRACGGSR
jgi:hypothetical protein